MTTEPSVPDILCLGSILWDVVGSTSETMGAGCDRPGRIVQKPGGVAFNVAMALKGFGHAPALLGVVGQDAEGERLMALCSELGLSVDHVIRSRARPTDRYLAIECPTGLFGAIADVRTLEMEGAQALAPLRDGSLGTADSPWRGVMVLDGNFAASELSAIARDPCFAAADLRIVPASPDKAMRLRPLLSHPGAMVYLNLEEARHLTGAPCPDTGEAARAVLRAGGRRVIVTNGAHPVAFAGLGRLILRQPPGITPHRVTGAGDTFMAAHIASELSGADVEQAIDAGLAAALTHISMEAIP